MSRQDLHRLVTDFVTPVKTVVHVDQTIAEALQVIRRRNINDKIIYFYVVNEENKLLGVVSTRKLLLNDPSRKITDVMDRSVICLSSSQTLKEALEFLESHHLLALPVVDEENRFLGVIDVDLYLEESIDVASSRLRTEVFQLIGMYVEEGKHFSLWKHYRNRMPWITCNLLGGISCAVISRFYELVLSKVIILAMFIPLVLTLSESISMQSVTQSIQMLRRKTIKVSYALQILFREIRIVALLGGTCGLGVGIVSLLWGEGFGPGIVIGSGIFFGVTISASLGAAVPLVLHIRAWDPKVAAGPVVLMFADVLTTAIYLTIASFFLL